MSTASVAGMRVVGVIDLKDGTAVHAVRGERERYRPIGDALSLARRFGLDELYVADLDAITGAGGRRVIIARWRARRASWSTRGPASRSGLLDLGVYRVVVGTETLADADALLPDAVLSVDLRDGRVLRATPARRPHGARRRRAPRGTCARSSCSTWRGWAASSGPDVEAIAEIHAAFPELELLAGGGVRDADDLRALEDAGSGALVATALHRGDRSR